MSRKHAKKKTAFCVCVCYGGLIEGGVGRSYSTLNRDGYSELTVAARVRQRE